MVLRDGIFGILLDYESGVLLNRFMYRKVCFFFFCSLLYERYSRKVFICFYKVGCYLVLGFWVYFF